MQDQWTDRLSEYLDGELPDADRAAIESHLAGCRQCAATLDDLRRVVDRARTIGPRPPQADLWPAIADRIAIPGWPAAPKRARGKAGAWQPRRFSFTLPQLAAASVLIAVASGGLVWRLQPSVSPAAGQARGSSSEVRSVDARGADVQTGSQAVPEMAVRIEPVSLADAQYDAAVADLERALARGRGRLDKATIAIVEENLKIIDQAIAQAREALAGDPANSYLSGHLVEARRKKLDLLRRAAALTSETN